MQTGDTVPGDGNRSGGGGGHLKAYWCCSRYWGEGKGGDRVGNRMGGCEKESKKITCQ